MRTRWRCIVFSHLGLYRWADNTFLSASFVSLSVGYYILRDLTTVCSISAFLSRWSPLGGWQSDTAVPIRGIIVPTIGSWKLQQDQFLPRMYMTLFVEGIVVLGFGCETCVYVCVCVHACAYMWEGGASAIHLLKGMITWSMSLRGQNHCLLKTVTPNLTNSESFRPRSRRNKKNSKFNVSILIAHQLYHAMKKISKMVSLDVNHQLSYPIIS